MSSTSRTSWDAAIHVIEKLRTHGQQALLAGGCVRDRILQRTPKDYDVATDALPEKVHEIFPRANHIGAKFGVMLVKKYGFDIEVATFRSDGIYSDGRHPDEVTFGTEVEDAQRRDFTINGLFFDPSTDEVIDHVAGRADLQAGIIRTIGDPMQRFAEDHLRLLRAVRFAARLGFEIEEQTFEAIRRLAPRLSAISPERIWLELEKILTCPARSTGWSLLVDTGLRNHLITNWKGNAASDAIALKRLENLPDGDIDSALSMACLFAPHDPKCVAEWCRALRLSNRLCESIKGLIQSLTVVLDEKSLELADLKMLMADADWSNLIDLLRVDLLARGKELDGYHTIKQRASEIAETSIAPPPFLNGDELTDMGMEPGPAFGEILKVIYRAQLNETITTKEQAVELAKELMGNLKPD